MSQSISPQPHDFHHAARPHGLKAAPMEQLLLRRDVYLRALTEDREEWELSFCREMVIQVVEEIRSRRL